ncbi:MAG: hypothetical protein FWD96_02310 [Defluviitaleaceae bacterium]|nr:hypothetical protein [Defluviitaleaceae bacterium]
MGIAFNNIGPNTGNINPMVLQSRKDSQRSAGRHSRRDSIMQERLQEKRREMQIRAQEDEHIKAIKEKMQQIRDSDSSIGTKMDKLDMLTNKIVNIHENRADRELMAAEREMARTKALLEETAQEREREVSEQHKDPEEAKKQQEREALTGLTRLAVSQDRLSALKQNRAMLTREAGQIRRAIESPNSNYMKVGLNPDATAIAEGYGIIINTQFGRGNPQDFRNQHLSKLTLGIARTTAAINTTIAGMYRESSKLQESQLKHYMQHAEEAEAQEQEREEADAEYVTKLDLEL